MIDNTKEYILCAAVKRRVRNECNGSKPYHEGTNDICDIEIGYRHHDIYQRFDVSNNEECPLDITMEGQGFYTSKGRFVDRYEGMEIAYNAGQVSEERALSKKWWKENIIKGTDTEGNEMDEHYWEKHEKHKFNMLASEDLY